MFTFFSCFTLNAQSIKDFLPHEDDKTFKFTGTQPHYDLQVKRKFESLNKKGNAILGSIYFKITPKKSRVVAEIEAEFKKEESGNTITMTVKNKQNDLKITMTGTVKNGHWVLTHKLEGTEPKSPLFKCPLNEEQVMELIKEIHKSLSVGFDFVCDKEGNISYRIMPASTLWNATWELKYSFNRSVEDYLK